MRTAIPAARAAAEHLQAAFLALLPKIRRVAQVYFRRVACADRKDDCVCETVALCWAWYLRLIEKGRNPALFATALARYAACAVNSGRRVCGQEKTRDALSPVCQRRRQFVVSPLPERSTLEGSLFDDAIADNTRTPVPDQVQFRCDFPEWKDRLSGPKQRLVEGLALGHRTTDLAVEFGLSAGRISQLRKEFKEGYQAFCGDPA